MEELLTTTSKYRGNAIVFLKNEWHFEETGKSVPETHSTMKCGHCQRKYSKEGHDGCLGTLIGLMNACCGHGDIKETYVQFWDGEVVDGEDAKIIIDILKKYKIENVKERQEFLDRIPCID